MMKISECAGILRENDRFLMLTHTRPDGDTLCSAAALCACLRRMGKKAWLYPNPEITENYAPLVEEYLCDDSAVGSYYVSIDLADVTLFPKGFEGEVDLAIDHHASNSGYAKRSLVQGEKAACGEIVMELIEELCGELTSREADLLYTAVSTDTGCFCYGNTKADTFRAAAKLLDYGARNGQLNKQLFRSHSFSRLMLEGLVYADLRSYRNHSINVAVITLDMMARAGATENDCDDLASLAGKVKGNVVSITVRQIEDKKSKISVRTNETVNASEICARFGGGGHAMAAGCTLEMGPDEAAEQILAVVEEIWK